MQNTIHHNKLLDNPQHGGSRRGPADITGIVLSYLHAFTCEDTLQIETQLYHCLPIALPKHLRSDLQWFDTYREAAKDTILRMDEMTCLLVQNQALVFWRAVSHFVICVPETNYRRLCDSMETIVGSLWNDDTKVETKSLAHTNGSGHSQQFKFCLAAARYLTVVPKGCLRGPADVPKGCLPGTPDPAKQAVECHPIWKDFLTRLHDFSWFVRSVTRATNGRDIYSFPKHRLAKELVFRDTVGH